MRFFIDIADGVREPLARLAAHKAIGWDFDETLIDSPASGILNKFIIDHPEIRHVIVTFRTHGFQDRVFQDLRDFGQVYRERVASKKSFSDVLNVDDELFIQHYQIAELRHFGHFSGPLTPEEIAYRDWKGKICKKNGLTALVDDNVEHTREGCEKAGVKFFDTALFF